MRKLNEADFKDRITAFNRHAVELWNAGDLERFCDGYSPNAVIVTKDWGLIRGRDVVLGRYVTDFPDRKDMGYISVDVREIHFPPHEPDEAVSMAGAIVHWKISMRSGQTQEGFSMITFDIAEEGIWITQDVSA